MSGKSHHSDESHLSIRLVLSLIILIGFSISWVTNSATGQEPASVSIQPESKGPLSKGRRGYMRGPQPQPSGQPSPKEPEKKEKGKPDEKKEDDSKKPEKEPIATVKRPTDPPQPANPDELKVRPDASGQVEFSFRGQPWADVLQWFADVADYSFDWQELPADFLNLTTKKKYTLSETRDLLNRHLLARGFTMVVLGEVMTVVKIDKLDPSLVPRAEADDLEDYAPHDFMRVTFPLPSDMEPAKAAEDVKLLLSPNAKVTPLLASKRLLVLDAVANLRDVRDLLYAEQMASDRFEKPRQFLLKHRRADYVADQVMVVLGLDPSSRKSPQELQVEQQKMQMLMKMQQKGKDVTKMLQKDGPQVFLAVNRRQNSILVNAPPELMPTIERTIEMFDIPDENSGLVASGIFSMERYKTVTASTDKVIEVLQEIGNLDPRTQLQSDSASKTIYATATQDDHDKIRKILDRLDGTGRRASVIWLRRLSADQVAGTLMALLVGEEKKEDSSRRRRYSYFGYGDSNDQQKEQQGTFKALADIENNRLLLWATEDELKEVHNILGQLGEMPSDQGGNPSRVRVLQSVDTDRATELLRRLESAWSGKNRLRIHGPPGKGPPDNKETDQQPPKKRAPASQASQGDTLTQRSSEPPMGTRLIRLASLQSDLVTRGGGSGTEQAEKPSSVPRPEAQQGEPPIDVVLSPDGQIILKCDDPAALDELEDLLGQLAPAQDIFHLFELRNASASLVVLNLEEYFEEELKGQKTHTYNYWGEYTGSKEKEMGATTLSKRPLLRFIYDIDTNTIVVQNASPTQLRTIERLIKIYDSPVAEDSVLARRTEAIKIRYSRATDIATALKEVYRDLLSSKDKEFQGKDGQQKERTETHYRFYGAAPPDNKKKPAAVKIAFEGALSIGVDELSNTLIISTQEEVWENVRLLVEHLDESARPNTVVQVHEVHGFISPASLQKSLAEALSEPWQGGKPHQSGGKQSGKGEKGEQPKKKEERKREKGE